MYFSKKKYVRCAMGSGAAVEFSRICVSKVTLSLSLLITVTYRKKMGEQDVLLAPPIILLGEQLLAASPAPPVPSPMTIYAVVQIRQCGCKFASLTRHCAESLPTTQRYG